MSTRELGNLGERIACEYLVKNGYKIIGKNYRISFGEIDIIARKGWGLLDKTIHFVEVKTLFQVDEVFSPEQRADWKKQRKVKQLAEIWLQKNKYPQDIPYQIDIIAVSTDSTDNKPTIEMFENVVEEN